MVEILHFLQQRHLADHDGGDPDARPVSRDDELLHRQESLFPPHLPALVHLTVGALSHFGEQLVGQRLIAVVHVLPHKLMYPDPTAKLLPQSAQTDNFKLLIN